MWVQVDAITGYFYDFDIKYVGMLGGNLLEVGLGERVVLQLCRPLQGGNYQIFCDNFFYCFLIIIAELLQQIYACRMTQIDRCGFPEILKSVVVEELEQSEPCDRGNLAAVWRDKKGVKILATMSSPLTSQPMERKQKDGSKVMLPCPHTVVVIARRAP